MTDRWQRWREAYSREREPNRFQPDMYAADARALLAERDALAESADKLHKALREHNVGQRYADDIAFENDVPEGGYCMVCERSWDGENERHAEGCLATPSAPKEGT